MPDKIVARNKEHLIELIDEAIKKMALNAI